MCVCGCVGVWVCVCVCMCVCVCVCACACVCVNQNKDYHLSVLRYLTDERCEWGKQELTIRSMMLKYVEEWEEERHYNFQINVISFVIRYEVCMFVTYCLLTYVCFRWYIFSCMFMPLPFSPLCLLLRSVQQTQVMLVKPHWTPARIFSCPGY